MRLKVYLESHCPSCGLEEVTLRIRRHKLIRWLYPKCMLMECRRCRVRFLVQRPAAGK